MHVSLIISSLGAGGAERNLVALGNALAQEKHRVSLLTYESLKQSAFYDLNENIERIAFDLLNQERVSLFNRACAVFKRIFTIRKHIKTLQPDVVISFVDVTNITVLLATLRLPTKVVVCERTHPKFHHLSWLHQVARQCTYPLAHQIVVQTASVRDYFPKWLRPKIKIIPNAVRRMDAMRTALQTQKPVKKIISVGRLEPNKGFDTLIEAFSHIHTQHREITLTIYGEGPYRKTLEQKIAALQLTEAVFLPGLVKPIEKRLLEADLFVSASWYEGFPNAVCEAMSVGLPVIVSNCVGHVDVVLDNVNGLFFPIADVAALTHKINELIVDADKRIALATQAKDIVVHFSSENILLKWNECIHG